VQEFAAATTNKNAGMVDRVQPVCREQDGDLHPRGYSHCHGYLFRQFYHARRIRPAGRYGSSWPPHGVQSVRPGQYPGNVEFYRCRLQLHLGTKGGGGVQDFKTSQVAWSHWLTIVACLAMVASLTTAVYLTVEPKSPWLAYMVIAMGCGTPAVMSVYWGRMCSTCVDAEHCCLSKYNINGRGCGGQPAGHQSLV
jgi:hypothetical protein